MKTSKKCFINLFLIMLLFIATNLQAQLHRWELQPEVGLVLRSLNVDPEDSLINTKSGVSFMGGVAGQYNIDNTWAIKLGLAYERKGADLEIANTTTGYYNLDYITVPLLVKAKFGEGNVRFFVNAGPYMGFLLSSKTKFDATANTPELEIDNDSTTKSTDLGISAGLGIEIYAGKSGAFTIEIRENLGLTDISDSRDVNEPAIKTNSVNFIIGYAFKFGKTYPPKR